MSAMGPHNSPMALATRPWGCLFWSVWAMILIRMGMLDIINLLVPGSFEAAFETETIEAYAQRWLMLAIGMSTALAGMMVWAEFVGAGPFAGSMKLRTGWAVLSFIGGPSILLFSILAIDLFVGSDVTNWAIREDISAELMDPANYGVLFAVLIIGIYPIAEEIAYRGIGLGFLLARGMEPAFAIGLVSFVWTLTHLQATPLGLIPIFVAGIFFGWLRVRTGSMAAPIIAHMAANGIQFLV